jgi:hypothetical protein
MGWFKKKEKEKLLVSFSHIKGIDINYDINTFITKSSSSLPKWWSTLKVDPLTPKKVFTITSKGENPENFNNVRTCPSFISLFNNSYLIKCPTDFYLVTKGDQFKWYSADKSVMSASTHPLSQMNNHLKGKYFNLKFDFPFIVKPKLNPISLIFFPPTYYNDFPFHVMPGILELIPNFSGNMALNCLVKCTKETQYYFFPKGKILSMLYCPTPPPELEETDMTYTNKDRFQAYFLRQKKEWISKK